MRALPTLFFALALLVAGFALARWVDRIGGPAAVRARFGAAAPLLTGGVQIAVTPTPFPTDILCIAHGTLYGFWPGAGLNWLAWWLAALLEYGLGRRARRDFDLERHRARLPRWLRAFPADHPVYLIGARQIPWAGGHLTTFVPGALGVPFRRHAWCAALAILPGAFIWAALGAGLLRLW